MVIGCREPSEASMCTCRRLERLGRAGEAKGSASQGALPFARRSAGPERPQNACKNAAGHAAGTIHRKGRPEGKNYPAPLAPRMRPCPSFFAAETPRSPVRQIATPTRSHLHTTTHTQPSSDLGCPHTMAAKLKRCVRTYNSIEDFVEASCHWPSSRPAPSAGPSRTRRIAPARLPTGV